MHNESTSCPSISTSGNLFEGEVELVSSSSVSIPSVSDSSGHSVTTETLATNGHGLDQTLDSIGSPSGHLVTTETLPTNGHGLDQTLNSVGSPSEKMLVGNGAIECEPNDDTSKLSNTNIHSGHLSSIEDGENLVHKQVQANVESPTVSVQKTTANSKRSPLRELLIYPTPTQRKAKPNCSARVLTSAESIALLEEKARKKQEEKEEKERKKKEREMKKNLREEEKKRKAQEREAKKAEKQKSVNKKKTKGQKRGNSSDESASTTSKRQRVDSSFDESQDTGIQHREVSTNECAACFGLYEDDPEPAEWIRCTNEECQVWSHADCLEKCEDAYVCVVCETLLL